ncbi:MAG: DUF929 family protein [Candidatus Micrarchaeota archaeon]|nr:DUF929 family protein [Candidatus Micrarchaeota archaeon]MDE1834675.1 DUF929 family protein [Candidatus Micrarchaeota archaeon]MDE1859577.1 DUF929 family protein [Candidatus Micrarchaeota archaeon]
MPKANPKRGLTGSDLQNYARIVKTMKSITYLALAIGIIAIIVSSATAIVLLGKINAIKNLTLTPHNGTTAATTTATAQSTLRGIGDPLNASQLSVINNGPNAYYEKAGQMYLNGSLTNGVYPGANKVKGLPVDNKTTVIYLGSITCIFCGENRWAMALALSRFGSFSTLYKGYSSLGDGDVPTLYWAPLNYNISSDYIGNGYSSKYINFLSIEDTHPISGGFALNTFGQMQSNIERYNNATYNQAFNYIVNLSSNKTTAFSGTPYTIWGTEQFSGADAVDFGNSSSSATLQIAGMTHAQILDQFANPNDQFGWTEYAAADVYIAALCSSLPNSTRSSVSACSLPAILQIGSQSFK